MKIYFKEIAKYEIQIIEYLGDHIFKFKINCPDLFNEKWSQYESQLNTGNSVAKSFLEKEIVGNRYERIGSMDEIMKVNFEHCYRANYYYTNGQKIVSVIENEAGFEIGVHKSNDNFTNYFYPNSGFAVFSLENCFVQTYKTKEKMESEISKVLSVLEVERIPLEHDSNIDYIELQKLHLSDYIIRYDNSEKLINLRYEGPTFDTEFKEFLKLIMPRKAICCLECHHFQFSGMSHSMSGGHTGYCQMMRNQLEEDSNIKQSITNITNYCGSFKRK